MFQFNFKSPEKRDPSGYRVPCNAASFFATFIGGTAVVDYVRGDFEKMEGSLAAAGLLGVGAVLFYLESKKGDKND